MRKLQRNSGIHIGSHLILLLAVVVSCVPFIWMILTSFKTYEESIRIPLTFLPGQWNLTNYSTVWHKFPFLNFYINTFVVMVVVIVGERFISTMAAYAFARLNFPFRNAIFVFSSV